MAQILSLAQLLPLVVVTAALPTQQAILVMQVVLAAAVLEMAEALLVVLEHRDKVITAAVVALAHLIPVQVVAALLR
jgi:hypothetical protein